MASPLDPDPRESATPTAPSGRLPLVAALAALAALIVCFVVVVQPDDHTPADTPQPVGTSRPAQPGTGGARDTVRQGTTEREPTDTVSGDKATDSGALRTGPSAQPSQVRPLP